MIFLLALQFKQMIVMKRKICRSGYMHSQIRQKIGLKSSTKISIHLFINKA